MAYGGVMPRIARWIVLGAALGIGAEANAQAGSGQERSTTGASAIDQPSSDQRESQADREAEARVERAIQAQQQRGLSEERLARTHEYIQVHLALHHVLLMASGHICSLKEDRSDLQREIRQERAAARYSGFVDKVLLHDLGQRIVAIDQEVREISALAKQRIGRTVISCSSRIIRTLNAQLGCDPSSDRGCNADVPLAKDLATAWLRGEEDLKSRDAELRSVVSEDGIAYADRLVSRISADIAAESKVKEKANAKSN